ncbi:twin-arginine translocation signal domain-containing protein [Bacillus sp. T3]|nr:twin-arginine translocation signal domain-containing protein [Bacillus sp. T3]
MADKKPLISTNMKRRTFLKWTGAAAVPVIAGELARSFWWIARQRKVV